MTYITEESKITFADGSEVEVKRLTEESSEEALTLEFSTSDYSGIRASFLDAEKTKSITTANETYKSFTKVKSITLTAEDESSDRMRVELLLDKYESEIDSVRSMVDELQSGLLELFELVYNSTEEEQTEEPVKEEPQEEEIEEEPQTEEPVEEEIEEEPQEENIEEEPKTEDEPQEEEA